MRKKTEKIRAFLIRQMYEKSPTPAAAACEKFGFSRQAVGRHIRRLIEEQVVTTEGKTKGRKYVLRPIANETFTLPVSPDLQEDRVWRERVLPLLAGARENVIRICEYGFTEMLNNVVDHSEGKSVTIVVERTIAGVTMTVQDDGVGIFKKIQRVLHLDDARHALLELTKGRVTTDPARHTGEGIFFSSRVFDEFSIRSDTLFFLHNVQDSDWLVDDVPFTQGTAVEMEISADALRTTKEVFDRYISAEEDYSFSRTQIPVLLARYGDENLVSRSQAKRLLSRVNRFTQIVLDFRGIQMIGQAFADEVFLVFQNEHPAVRFSWVGAAPEVEQTIKRVRSQGAVEPKPK